MGNKSRFTRGTDAAKVAKKMRQERIPAAYAKDKDGNFVKGDDGKKMLSREARPGVTWREAFRKLLGMGIPKPIMSSDSRISRARRKPVANVKVVQVPRYRAVAKPEHTRPGCKALRMNKVA